MAHLCQRILVVEDDDDVLAAIADFLESEGIHATLVRSGDEAIAALRRGPLPNAMLVDLGMPGMSGPELVQAVRREPAWAAIPLAIMSGYARDRFEYLPVVDAYLEKPFDIDRLNEALARLCRQGAHVG